jgi:hypothetical protein
MGRMGRREILSARAFAIFMALILSFGWPSDTAAHAVLAHEAVIDTVWDTSIRPLLLKRFPSATEEEIKEAHGYAYGGAIIQDMGVLPARKFLLQRLGALCAERGLLVYFVGFCSLCFLMCAQIFFVTSLRGSGSVPTILARCSEGCMGFMNALFFFALLAGFAIYHP